MGSTRFNTYPKSCRHSTSTWGIRDPMKCCLSGISNSAGAISGPSERQTSLLLYCITPNAEAGKVDKMNEFVTSTGLTAADAPLWNTAEHHGPVVSVVTWLLIIATVFVMMARVVTRYAIVKTLRWDDILAIFAMVRMLTLSLCHRGCLKSPLTDARLLLSGNPLQFLFRPHMGWVLAPTLTVQTSGRQSIRCVLAS